jgi:hypothetical protein
MKATDQAKDQRINRLEERLEKLEKAVPLR